MKNSSFLGFKFQAAVATSLFILSTLLTGCASLVEKGKLPMVVARQAPYIQLGPELILLEKPPIFSSSLIDIKGAAHVFIVDQERQLKHIKIINDIIIHREFLGIIEGEQSISLDAVEHPYGKLRVLAGDKQYYQVAPNRKWQEIRGNQCGRFVPVGDKIFCAFVVKGEEIKAPERTDYTFGWFLLVPIFSWSHEHASKLVLAEESSEGWIIRSVVDQDTPLDAHRDFLVETDNLGNIHFLYFTSKGGGTFFIFAYGYGGGANVSTPKPKLNYARLTLNQLLSHSTNALNQELSNYSNSMKWLSIKGVPMEEIPFSIEYRAYTPIIFNPLNIRFAVNKATGNVDGLIWTGQCPIMNAILEPKANPSIVEVSIDNGEWSPHFNIVATTDFPTTGISWQPNQNLSIKLDSTGKYHLLLQSFDPGWKNRKYINYLVKDAIDWSKPLPIGRSHLIYDVNSLAVGNSSVAFAAWVNEEGKFVGRWIKPRTGIPE